MQVSDSPARQALSFYRQELENTKATCVALQGVIDNIRLLLQADRSAKDTITMQDAILRVVREANGEALTIAEILERSQALGARSECKIPRTVIYNACAIWEKRGQLERSGQFAWRWATSD